MNKMCWCKDCKWFYKNHCVNGRSDNCTEMMGDYNSCKHSELRSLTVYTLYSYEDQEIKEVTLSEEKADEWINENRGDRKDDIRVEEWQVE